MKRLTTMLLGIALVMSSTGCYCWTPWFGGYGTYPGGGAGAGAGGCWGGNCGVAPMQGTIPPQGAYYNTYDTIQSAMPAPVPLTAVPPVAAPMVSLGPMEALPTYR